MRAAARSIAPRVGASTRLAMDSHSARDSSSEPQGSLLEALGQLANGGVTALAHGTNDVAGRGLDMLGNGRRAIDKGAHARREISVRLPDNTNHRGSIELFVPFATTRPAVRDISIRTR